MSSVKTTLRVGRGAQQRQQRARQAERREQIDPQRREPRIEGLMLDRTERAELHGGVHDRVDPPVLRLQRARDVGEVLGARRREVERQDRRLRVSGVDDLVVERFELAHDASVQHDGRALRRAGEREHSSQPAARAGDERHPAVEQSAGRVIEGR